MMAANRFVPSLFVVWLQNRIKELEEALEQERAAHFRVSNRQIFKKCPRLL